MATCRADPAVGGQHRRVQAYLQLLRPANVLTAVTDGIAGFAICGFTNLQAVPWLLLATASLYAGGVVLNDYFDREIDARERPERPIPSGRVGAAQAGWIGAILLPGGVLAALRVNQAAGAVAAAIALLVLLYDAWGKHRGLFGPVNMGLCRGLNLLLGMAAVPAVLAGRWPLGLLAFLYICGVTALSRGEVHGGKRPVAVFSLAAVAAVLVGLLAVALAAGPQTIWALALLAVLGWRVLPPFLRALRDPGPLVIRSAVRTGVLSLGILDAVLATAFAGPVYGTLVVMVSLLALGLARLFAVT